MASCGLANPELGTGDIGLSARRCHSLSLLLWPNPSCAALQNHDQIAALQVTVVEPKIELLFAIVEAQVVRYVFFKLLGFLARD